MTGADFATLALFGGVCVFVGLLTKAKRRNG